MNARFADQVVVITGAGGGIGRAAAARFAAEGARIVAVDRERGLMEETEAAVTRAGGEVFLHAADVTRAADVAAYARAAQDRFGRIDVLFNNAGIEGWIGSFLEYPETEFDRVFAVNVKGVWLGIKAVVPVMRAGGGGAIINTASIAGLSATPTLVAYGASKHAVIGLTRSAAVAFAGDGIRVNAICPGPIETRMMRAIERGTNPDDVQEAHDLFAARAPMRRYGTPEEVAALVAFLASDDAAFITGGIYPIDGGNRAR